jgi:hypothetical protein
MDFGNKRNMSNSQKIRADTSDRYLSQVILFTLQEWAEMPTANAYADGQISVSLA